MPFIQQMLIQAYFVANLAKSWFTRFGGQVQLYKPWPLKHFLNSQQNMQRNGEGREIFKQVLTFPSLNVLFSHFFVAKMSKMAFTRFCGQV